MPDGSILQTTIHDIMFYMNRVHGQGFIINFFDLVQAFIDKAFKGDNYHSTNSSIDKRICSLMRIDSGGFGQRMTAPQWAYKGLEYENAGGYNMISGEQVGNSFAEVLMTNRTNGSS